MHACKVTLRAALVRRNIQGHVYKVAGSGRLQHCCGGRTSSGRVQRLSRHSHACISDQSRQGGGAAVVESTFAEADHASEQQSPSFWRRRLHPRSTKRWWPHSPRGKTESGFYGPEVRGQGCTRAESTARAAAVAFQGRPAHRSYGNTGRDGPRCSSSTERTPAATSTTHSPCCARTANDIAFCTDQCRWTPANTRADRLGEQQRRQRTLRGDDSGDGGCGTSGVESTPRGLATCHSSRCSPKTHRGPCRR